MISFRAAWAVAALVCSFVACSSAEEETPPTPDAAAPTDAGALDASDDAAAVDAACATALAALQSGLDAERTAQRAPHAALAISTPRCGDQIVYSSGKEPAANAETMFRVASISKMFLSSVIVTLAEQGKLSLDDKVSRWFSAYPRSDEVTVRMLLNHTSGIPDYLYTSEYAAAARPGVPLPSVDTRISWVNDLEFTNEPGARWEYSNTNYLIASRIVDQVSGLGWAQAIRQGPFARAGLERTFVYGEEEVVGTIAASVNATEIEWVGADGAVVTTPSDMLKWLRALYIDRTVLSPGAFTELTTTVPIQSGISYGLGVMRYENALTTGLGYALGHSGSVPGAVSNAQPYPEKQASSAIFLCKSQGDMVKLLDLAEKTIGQLLTP